MPTNTSDPSPSTRLPRKVLKDMRAIAHNLHPTVILSADPGDTALAELERALGDHELIKVRVNVADRKARARLIDDVAAAAGAQEVQRIGRIVVLYRPNPEATPELSNVARSSRKEARKEARTER